MYIWINDMKIHNQAPETLGSTSTRAWCFETDRLRAGGVHVVVHENFPRVFEDRKSAFLDFACTWGVEILLEHHEIPETYVEVISRIKDGVLVVHPVCFQQKIFGNKNDFHLHLVILFFESKDLRMDADFVFWFVHEALNAFKENCLRFRNCMPEDGAVVKQLGGEAVDHNFYVDDGYLLYEYEGFKAISSYLPLFPRLSFPCPILTSVFFFRCATFPPATKARPAPVRLLLSLGKNYEGATWCCHCGNKKMDPILPTWVTKTDFPFKMWSVSFFGGGFLNCGIWSNGLCQC